MNGIYEFVLRGGQRVTAGAMNEFQRKIPFVKVKAETLNTPEFPLLPEQIRFLARYLEDALEGAYPCEDLSAVSETVFGLGYLMQDVDIIPDSVPGKGYADDAAVMKAVLLSHQQEFEKFAASSGLDYKALVEKA